MPFEGKFHSHCNDLNGASAWRRGCPGQARARRRPRSDEARLLLQFVPHQGETVCLFLEVIANHAYEKSRFLRGAAVDRDRIEAGPDDLRPEAEASGWAFKWLPPEAVAFDLLDKPLAL